MRELSENQVAMLQERRIASVATISPDGMPHLTSVWFLFEDGTIYLAIPSSSVKAHNLERDARVAVMIDVRESYREKGVTAIGRADLIQGADASSIVQKIHEKYLTDEALQDPSVGPVFAAFDDIAVQLIPSKWITWNMSELDKQAFAGKLVSNGYLREIRR